MEYVWILYPIIGVIIGLTVAEEVEVKRQTKNQPKLDPAGSMGIVVGSTLVFCIMQLFAV